MAAKRSLDDVSSARKAKKSKIASTPQFTSTLLTAEVDFPRGGGTSFTPLQVKAIRAEAVKEADNELFKESSKPKKMSKKKQKSETNATTTFKAEKVRIEHLNYKRLVPGMKIFGQIVSVLPLALIVSLPNQLYGHIPITNISTQLTNQLEKMGQEEDADEQDEEDANDVPELTDMFKPGQYVRAIVTTVHSAGTTDALGLSRSKDDAARMSRRVELSLVPEKVNEGVQAADLTEEFTLSASVQSVEDHGYTLDIGMPTMSGFLPFKDASKTYSETLPVGYLLAVVVKKVSSNGRICNVSVDRAEYASACLSEAVNATSVLPGTMVQCLITEVHPDGLHVQVLGFFDGTIDQFQLRRSASEKSYKVGKKIKARVLYNYQSSPPRFALSLTEHVMSLGERRCDAEKDSLPVREAYPIGTVIENAKVVRLEPERGLVLETHNGQQGFVHISHVSDDHVPSLSTNSGAWKIGSTHTARVTGYFAFDGLLQLSLKRSVLEQQFLQPTDIQVGEVLKGTIKRLTDSGLFVALSGNIDGLVKPHHYADITLKHPAKKFKVGASIKVRALAIDPERKFITLTAKKSLLESTLPVVTSIDEAKVGIVTQAVVSKVLGKQLIVEFYNGLKALIPIREVAEIPPSSLAESFSIGRVVQVRIISTEPESNRIVASIRQGSASFGDAVADISIIEVGNIVQGVVMDIHKDNAVLKLSPSKAKALVSLKNMANYRGISVVQLQKELKVGEELEDLVVVSRNTEKSLVIVAHKPKSKASVPGKGNLSMNKVTVGQIVGGRVTRQTRAGTLVKLTSHIGGILHPTDVSDDYENCTPFPAVDSVLKAAVIEINTEKKQLVLSTRQSRMDPDAGHKVIDREIKDLSSLKEGEQIRGFIKSVADHGLFVTLGRNIDARVQIRELFDEYVKDWKPRFSVNQLVKGYITKVDSEKGQVEMSFRSPEVRRKAAPSAPIDLSVGMKVEGTVKRIEEYGLFIQFTGSKLTGLCHKSELADNEDADVSAALHNFHLGDCVKAYVLAIDQRRVSLSLKPSHFADDTAEEDEMQVDHSHDINNPDVGGHSEEEEEEEEISLPQIDEDSESEDENMDVDLVATSASQVAPLEPISNTPDTGLQLTGGFQWFGNDTEEKGGDSSGISDTSDEEGPSTSKKKKRRKQIEHDLTADMQNKTPDSNADFERVLLGSPNSSFLWIKYMSFQLQLSEVDKAREIAKRALQTISFREEQEKLNVWIALLNLESAYGTDESLDSSFKDAVRHNDAKTVHLRMASILEQAEKLDKAEDIYKRTCKKFSQSSKVWTLFAEHYLRRGDVEQARQLLPRSLQSLEKRKHLKTISKFAQLEYKLGEPERGRTIFEGIVDSHFKRWDLWSIYIDMEATKGNIQHIRNLFDRVLALKMNSYKAKSFFKKWLNLERNIGDEEGQEVVKQKAVEWTQRAASS